jgi:hypothetical protein
MARRNIWQVGGSNQNEENGSPPPCKNYSDSLGFLILSVVWYSENILETGSVSIHW